MRRLHTAVLATALLMFGLANTVLPAAPAGAVVPPGFSDEMVTAVGGPTALAFVPDGRMLVTTQPGQVRVFVDGALLASPAIDLASRICSNSERGVLGVAVDPAFATNGFVFLYYSYN